MIAGFGADLVGLPDFATLLEDTASAFSDATFTAREIAYARAAPSRDILRHLAARYAAKEAAVKAFGSAGVQDAPIALCDIEVVNSASGAPMLAFHRRAEVLVNQLGIVRAWLSMSHDGDYALANVVFERGVESR